MSRHDGRSTRLRHRPSRAVPALIVGILLLAAGVLLVWLTVARLVNGTWPNVLQGPRDWLTSLAWNGSGAWWIGIAAVVIGVILLLCAIVPGGFSALMLNDAGGSREEKAGRVQEQEIVMTRRAVAHLAKAQCRQIDGVGSASATATTKHVHLSVQTPLHDTGDLRSRVTDSVRNRLEATGLNPVPRVTATIRSKG
ncbi:DUF6286 domain-containing protein [Paenarthrobacter sp. PH39-S1]|uniref:DUF6286 domain-containing protein n=1 Tax=Paenarthrobacter sp. PH39-S1 TaxID=3046204 RepID=UPI0024BB5A96|nr:DUF6286 domain-containing protein [Paenarthrobacter sp. PH39-S1]MDJ0358529.1 DUF6286 domain-containing protein [Paenarthrobacter sp. PH39-S1]